MKHEPVAQVQLTMSNRFRDVESSRARAACSCGWHGRWHKDGAPPEDWRRHITKVNREGDVGP